MSSDFAAEFICYQATREGALLIVVEPVVSELGGECLVDEEEGEEGRGDDCRNKAHGPTLRGSDVSAHSRRAGFVVLPEPGARSCARAWQLPVPWRFLALILQAVYASRSSDPVDFQRLRLPRRGTPHHPSGSGRVIWIPGEIAPMDIHLPTVKTTPQKTRFRSVRIYKICKEFTNR